MTKSQVMKLQPSNMSLEMRVIWLSLMALLLLLCTSGCCNFRETTTWEYPDGTTVVKRKEYSGWREPSGGKQFTFDLDILSAEVP